MRRYVIALLIALVAAAGAVALTWGDDPSAGDEQAAGPQLEDTDTADLVGVTGDGVANDDALGTQGEVDDVPSDDVQPEVEDPTTSPPIGLTRDAILGDLALVIEARTADFTEIITALDGDRRSGRDIGEGLTTLLDDVSILGETVITGIAVTPEALEIVPDLRERHEALISGVDDLYDVLSQLDPNASDETWEQGLTLVADTLTALGASIG